MNIATRIAGVVLASSAICGIGAGTALADTSAPSAGQHDATGQVGKALYSRGFTVYNLSQHPMTLQQALPPREPLPPALSLPASTSPLLQPMEPSPHYALPMNSVKAESTAAQAEVSGRMVHIH